MNQTSPTLDIARAVRVIHVALVGGVVATGAVFAFLVQVNRFTFLASPVLGAILAGVPDQSQER
ncbi:MAG TPA: hypothetical protein VN803_07535 [Gemmatimonadales bacterium]|nr:hypothetical protein [Gemmatimonadales bacterium]